LQRIKAHGAELILTDPIEGYDFAIHQARRMAAAEPERYWYCDQYSNRHNWRAHYEETASEILAQVAQYTGSSPDALVAGVGTGGTLTGVARRLREVRPALHVSAVIPDAFPGIEGLKPLGHAKDIVPALLDQSLIDRRIPVSLDDAVAMCKRLALHGLFVGPSSGAFVHAALKLAAGDNFHTIVTLLSDTGERYGTTGMWQTN
jgi:S-sulfo-L-cysteine synthase (O-acetyl-L-serine-dependent)